MLPVSLVKLVDPFELWLRIALAISTPLSTPFLTVKAALNWVFLIVFKS
jgi:hypothetical protein